MEDFEKLLNVERAVIERFVRLRMDSEAEAEDVLQEVYFAAWRKFSQLKNREHFRAWLLSIARNKCNDYFRKKAARPELLGAVDDEPGGCARADIRRLPRGSHAPLSDAPSQMEPSDGRFGILEAYTVRETMEQLGDKDKQILYLYFWKEMPQAEIARRLDIPVGTVKSRLHTAKQNFKSKYSCHTGEEREGWRGAKELPKRLFAYRIEASAGAPFEVKWEELMSWFLIPRTGERLSWGMYEAPSGRRCFAYDMEAAGRTRVHGIAGVELRAREAPYSDKNLIDRTFVAQLTDTHCRYLAATRNEGGIRSYLTFLDGDAFFTGWGFGEANCGHETSLFPKGNIRKDGRVVTGADRAFLQDIVGRYTVTINQKRYDAVCLMTLESYGCGMISEQYLDREGRTLLWRGFSRMGWVTDRLKKIWGERIPESEQLLVNGTPYLHWCDCITDYIL